MTRGLGALVASKFQPYVGAAASVLDFGCGSGENLAELRCGSKVGVEANPASLAYLSSRQIRGFDRLSDVPTSSIDVVISHHALEHCLTPYEELVQMRRVLRPTGRLVLILPIDDWRTQKTFNAKDINHHLYTWSPLLIGNLVLEAGFSLEEAVVLTYQWPPKVRFLSQHLPGWAFRWLCWWWSVATRMREMRVVAIPAESS